MSMGIGERFAWVRAVIAAQPRPSLAEAAVAVVLAEHYNAERGAAWPAQKTMGGLLGRSRRTIREALTSLEGRGLIALVRAGGPQESAAYALVMPSDGGPSRHQRADRPAISGRTVTPSAGGPSRPEQVSRNDSVGKTYGAAHARSPYGSRVSGGTTKNSSKRRPTTVSVISRLPCGTRRRSADLRGCWAARMSVAALTRRGKGVAGRSARRGDQPGAAATPLDDGAEAGVGRGGDASGLVSGGCRRPPWHEPQPFVRVAAAGAGGDDAGRGPDGPAGSAHLGSGSRRRGSAAPTTNGIGMF